MEPSPAAAVTRFTDPLRTSPAPKTPDWRRERALPDPRRQPAPWRPWPRSPSAGPGGAVRLTLASPAQGRYVLVWLNSRRTPAGTYKAEIYGIAVKGHPGAWAGKASPEPGGLTGPISPGPCGPGSALSAGPHTARTCSSRPVPAPAARWSGRQAGLSGSVMRLPPGGGTLSGNPPPPGPECSQFGRWPRTKTHSVGQRGMLAARLAGRLNGPR